MKINQKRNIYKREYPTYDMKKGLVVIACSSNYTNPISNKSFDNLALNNFNVSV